MLIKQIFLHACFETIYRSMTSRLLDWKNKGKLRADLSHLEQSYSNSFRPSLKDIRTHKILNQLRKNNDVVILKPDKR